MTEKIQNVLNAFTGWQDMHCIMATTAY